MTSPAPSHAPAASTKRPASSSPDQKPPNTKIDNKPSPPRTSISTGDRPAPTGAGTSVSPSVNRNVAAGTTTPKQATSSRTTSPQQPSSASSTSSNAARVAPAAANPANFGGPLQPASVGAGSLIPNLDIVAFEEGKQTVKLTSTQRYPIIEKVIHKALNIMDSKAGIEKLVQVAKSLIDYRKTNNEEHTWGNRPDSELPKEMKTFLAKLRAEFPQIQVKNIKEDANTLRWLWPEGRDVLQVPVPDLGQFIPHECMYLELNTKVISNLMKAMEEKAKGTQGMDEMIQQFHFHLIITVCHEIIHMLVCALSGAGEPETPNNMTVPGHDDPESGWFWEILAFGGIVAMFMDKNETVLKERQAGIPMLADGKSEQSLVHSIKKDYIANFVKASPSTDFSYFPIQTVPSTATETWKQAQKRIGTQMGAVLMKTRCVRNPSEKNSPEPKKAPKAPVQGTRTSGRNRPDASKAARDSSPSPAPRTRPTQTTLPIARGKPAA